MKTRECLRHHNPGEFSKLWKEQRNDLSEFKRSNRSSETPRKRQRFSRESETQTLVSDFVAKDLKALKKAEKKKEDKDQELGSQIVNILK